MNSSYNLQVKLKSPAYQRAVTVAKVGNPSQQNDFGVYFEEDSFLSLMASLEAVQLKATRHDLNSAAKKSTDEIYRPLIDRIKENISSGRRFFSLEFFPPHTTEGLINLLKRVDIFANSQPLFVDVTWVMRSDPASEKVTSSSSLADCILNFCLLDTMLHITSVQYDEKTVLFNLERAKKIGIRNILALRGDISDDAHVTTTDFQYACQLVRFIRSHYGDYFTICVADAGADFIITQLFFNEMHYFKFVSDCRKIGIVVPIIPGILPILSYQSIMKIVQLSKIVIPDSVLTTLESIKENAEAVRNFGISFAVQLCRKLLNREYHVVPGLHFYTLNQEKSILEQLGFWKKAPVRMFPWKKHTVHSLRCREAVRPIYWTGRPKSYLCRTRDWKQFPHSRWGDVGNPTFGDLKHYLFSCIDQMDDSCALDMWDKELSTLEHVRDIFCNFIARTPNRHGHSVRRLPWNENHLDPAADILKNELIYYNSNGILTINCQAAVNGLPSSDPIFGWGEANGYIYQKGYLEFFASSTCTTILLNHVQNFPSINYHAINFDGSFETFNYDEDATVALTWGVFVGQEIVQPTVASAASFRVWKDEAFDLWQRWAGLYESGSIGRKLLQKIHDDYRLITLIDNDYPQPCSLSALLRAVISDYWGKKLDDG
ncbi:putative methylenetetrahydrofolate reductase [Trichinella nelsoni]|uniref:Putative methylenetetrahydrofolate reductase n=1 Tax=Trichinella nelsoni TaxID=6336 RepID=A0A0V0RJ30_9BILA|nr:putative methylenetetrahydrofolate reductase [Trichinella nelsoni]